jgi:hypothetical protein
LGELTVDDPNKVHLIVSKGGQRSYHGEIWQINCEWLAYLPPGTRWQLCWKMNDIPVDGVPPTPDSAAPIFPTDENTAVVGVSLPVPNGSEPAARIVLGTRDRLATAPDDRGDWMDAGFPLLSDITGLWHEGRNWGSRTESFPPSKPIILCRIHPAATVRELSQGATKPSDGVLVWLERVE